MATQTTIETPDKTPRPKDATPKSFGTRLTSEAGEQLLVRAHKTKAGWRSEVRHKVGKVTTRGATQQHPTMEAARKAVETLAATAEKAGWVRKAARSFARMPDAFDAAHLPRPTLAKLTTEEVAWGRVPTARPRWPGFFRRILLRGPRSMTDQDETALMRTPRRGETFGPRVLSPHGVTRRLGPDLSEVAEYEAARLLGIEANTRAARPDMIAARQEQANGLIRICKGRCMQDGRRRAQAGSAFGIDKDWDAVLLVLRALSSLEAIAIYDGPERCRDRVLSNGLPAL